MKEVKEWNGPVWKREAANFCTLKLEAEAPQRLSAAAGEPTKAAANFSIKPTNAGCRSHPLCRIIPADGGRLEPSAAGARTHVSLSYMAAPTPTPTPVGSGRRTPLPVTAELFSQPRRKWSLSLRLTVKCQCWFESCQHAEIMKRIKWSSVWCLSFQAGCLQTWTAAEKTKERQVMWTSTTETTFGNISVTWTFSSLRDFNPTHC